MKNCVKLQISVPSQTRYLSLIGKIGENIVKEICIPQPDKEVLASNINSVLTEAIVNSIKHGSKLSKDMKVKIHISVIGNELLIRVYDHGQGFDLNTIPELTFDSDLLEECGRGIHIIRTLMDSVVYKKMNGVNVLEMKKLF